MTFKDIEVDTLENILEEASHCAALNKVQQPDVMIHQEAIQLIIPTWNISGSSWSRGSGESGSNMKAFGVNSIQPGTFRRADTDWFLNDGHIQYNSQTDLTWLQLSISVQRQRHQWKFLY